jgi:hypothetical protein
MRATRSLLMARRERMPQLLNPKSEVIRYQERVGKGGWSIKLMSLSLIAATGYFAYSLHAKGRMPWQHGLGLEYVTKREK